MPPINSTQRRLSGQNISNVKRSISRAEKAATPIRQNPSQISLRWVEVAVGPRRWGYALTPTPTAYPCVDFSQW